MALVSSCGRDRAGGSRVNRQDVLDQALATLDTYGFADLSMRRLAGSLGVQPGALYWHFANKQTLLLALAQVILDPVSRLDAVADEAGGGPASGPDTGLAAPRTGPAGWEERVRRWARTLHDALLAHRDGAEVVASVLALRPAGLDPARPCVRALVGAGLAPRESASAAAALVHYTVGHAVDAQTHAQAKALGVREVGHGGVDPTPAGERYEFGLDVFVAGLRQLLP